MRLIQNPTFFGGLRSPAWRMTGHFGGQTLRILPASFFKCSYASDCFVKQIKSRCGATSHRALDICHRITAFGSFRSNEPIAGMPGAGWRTASAARHLHSEVDLFSDAQSIFKLDTRVAHSAVHLGMAQQQLDGSKTARLAVNLRCFRPAQTSTPR